MLIELKYTDFQLINKVVDNYNPEQGFKHPLLFYENNDLLFLYRPIQSIIYYTIILKSQLSNVESFKLETLFNSFEIKQQLNNNKDRYNYKLNLIKNIINEDETSSMIEDSVDGI